MDTTRIFTLGHSTHGLEEFVAILHAHGIKQLADIRTIPRSRHNPQFNGETLETSLPEFGIDYLRFKDLGGLRPTHRDSINGGWHNESFRGYADYMQTPEFSQALDRLIALSYSGDLAVMCAEVLPWRCHRSLIGDALVIRGFEVIDIFSSSKTSLHKLTDFAVVSRLQITYPPQAGSAGLPET